METLWIKLSFINTFDEQTQRENTLVKFEHKNAPICNSCSPEDLRDKMFELEQFASIINPNIELKFMFKD
jgi:hypothetical protein